MPKALNIRLEIEIEAPPEKVWQVFSRRQGMQDWLGMQGYEPNVGGRYIMHVNAPAGKTDFFGEVTIYDPPRRLAFTWTQQEEGKEPWPLSTLVTLTLTPIPSGTKVLLEHSGFEALPEAIAEEEFSDHVAGWERSQALIELKEMVEG
jgi:uncharacterized protein YndB with AHSA1/START domain